MTAAFRSALVTGGGGFLGQAIVRRLIDKGYHVRSFSRSFHPELSKLSVEQHMGDLADASSVIKAAEGVHVIFHVAAKAGVWGPFSAYQSANVAGTRHVIDAALIHSIPNLIYTSSPSVIFNGKDMCGVDERVSYPEVFHSAYPKTKATAEKMVIDAGKKGPLRTIILRPHLIWGPGDNHLAPRIISRSARLKMIGSGNNRVDTIYIDNAAHAHILAEEALERNPALSGNAYFISQDEPILLWEMINSILDAGGKPPVSGRVSKELAFWAGAFLEFIHTIFRIGKEPVMTRFVARELATSHWFDISAAKRDLGYTPLISTCEGLKRLKEWLAMENKNAKSLKTEKISDK